MLAPQFDRRTFLKISAISPFALPRLTAAPASSSLARPRSLSFYNLHTTEKLNTVYWADGQYIPDSLVEINRILRDYRTGDIYEIAPKLLDMLCELRSRLDTNEPFELISGYRSPATNAMLRSQGHGVAENSLHTKGMAADIRVPGQSLALLRRTAIGLQAGGVGYYPESQFVHVDIGRIRTW